MTLRTARRSTPVKGLRALALVIAMSCGTAALVSCNSGADFVTDAYLVNQARGSVGADALGWSPALATKATNWAQHLADTGVLAHSVLAQGVPPGWHELGENVGYAGSVAAVHSGFLNSPPHAENMLNPRWRVMGIGAARAGDRVWVVEVYED
jgi:uncharacterized protein YkwD